MTTLFSGISMSLQSLLAQQQAMEVIEHNVANVNTPGYHRQSVILMANLPISISNMDHSTAAGQMGSGVMVQQFMRFTSDFLDTRYRNATSDSKRWELQGNVLQQLESSLAENTDNGLTTKLDKFWAGWQALASDPTNLSVRTDLLARSQDLAQAFSTRSDQITAMIADQNTGIVSRVDEINTLAQQVADLNGQVARVIAVGDQPNDLLDQRDLALDRLSELTGSTSSIQANGQVVVSINGHVLVSSTNAESLTVQPDPATGNPTSIVWSGSSQAMQPVNGELKGILEARDLMTTQKTGLDNLAVSLMDRINTLHSGGYGLDNTHGQPLFTGTDAGSMKLNTDLTAAQVACAGAPDTPGDNSVANAIAGVQLEKLMNGGSITVNQYYNQQVTSLGLAIKQANTNSSNGALVVGAINTQRQSLSGVNLDEEAANMVKAQRAYQAASRMMTAVDEMLNTVISGMGLVGR